MKGSKCNMTNRKRTAVSITTTISINLNLRNGRKTKNMKKEVLNIEKGKKSAAPTGRIA